MVVGILGGGLVGLVIGSTLDRPNEILEAGERPGGHCRTLTEEGYTFDLGGPHIIFSKNKEILSYIIEKLDGNVHERFRMNKILYNGVYVKYPFENGLYDLPPVERFECLRDFITNDYKQKGNFKDWLFRNFGTALTEKYLLPYNEKIWNVPAEAMSDDWVEGRVPIPSLDEIIKSAVGVVTEGAPHQAYFKYPIHGGIEALPKAFAKDCPSITNNFRVKRVWRENGLWHVSDGEQVRRYDRLVSTIAIQDMIAALGDAPEDVVRKVNALRFNSLSVVMLGMETRTPNEHTAVYVPDRKYPFHRLSMPLSFTDEGAPPGHEGIAAEITTNPGDGIHELDDDALVDLVVDGLVDLGLMQRDKLRFKKVERTRHAYVIRTFDYEENLKAGLDYLDSLGIISCGRNAEFAYINMDEAVRRGLEVTKRLQAEIARD
jgi:protoporphyrinogen oxidase